MQRIKLLLRRTYMRYLTLLLFPSIAFCQPISIGIKGGVPFTDAFNTATTGNVSYSSLTHRYTIGPMVEVRLPFHLGVEFDALYNRLNYNATTPQTFSSATANSWEFPLLLKYRFGGMPLIKPYVDAGPSFRSISGIKQITSVFSGTPLSSSTSNPPQLQNTFNAGFAFGAGIDVHAIFIHISPEIRFTRWGSQSFKDNVTGALNTNLNQASFLVGLTF